MSLGSGNHMKRAGSCWQSRPGVRSAPTPPDGKPCHRRCRTLSQSDSDFRTFHEITGPRNSVRAGFST